MPFEDPVKGQSATELQAQMKLERAGEPFVVVRTEGRGQELHPLSAPERVTIGRDSASSISLPDDPEVSTLHAELDRVGASWVVVDDGISSNGTFVNERPVRSRARLSDGDVIRVGSTGLLFRDPRVEGARGSTAPARGTSEVGTLTQTQRKILIALCRPLAADEAAAAPASNKVIADEVHLSVDAVKAQMRVLFERFGLSDLPQIEKRSRLAERALRSGAIRPGDLVD